MMVNVVVIMALASMSCVLGLDYYKLQLMEENIFNNFLIGKLKLYIYIYNNNIKAYLFHELHFCMLWRHVTH